MTNTEFLITLIVVIVVGILLFILTGIMFVPKDRVAVIEEYGEYKKTLETGVYYFAPLKARRVGAYKKTTIKEEFEFDNVKYVIYYKITNFKDYHYNGRSIELFIDDLKTRDNNLVFDDLKTKLIDYGVNIENIMLA